ncbi:MAG TPA: RuBisCO large subunit C-terminal-like domain-containing protein [Herpetosiphonaceae bacterium]|nr:RuBisCO large subunit C-terminal-like domain-containing protein [Herpetosiphonaceae bacterium]
MLPPVSLDLSGERFAVVYRLAGDESNARAKAQEICLEQTVEFPIELLPAGDIREQIVGRIEDLRRVEQDVYVATISYAVETTGFELPQLINVIFGNSSIKPGIRVEHLELPAALLSSFRGPRFGRAGLRELLGVGRRPLLCTALKPMGLSADLLAQQAFACALGGIDIVKDDHGLAAQPFAPFQERVRACADAVRRANDQTGRNAIYMPNVTAPADQVIERAYVAKEAGAGGLLVAPGIVGLDTMRYLAGDDRIALPIMSHPAFQGSFVTSPAEGLSHAVIFGQLARLAGADATIYPNFGGRFSFSREACRSIVEATAAPMGSIKSIFPTPGGGMSLARVPEMLDFYGPDVIFLIGGGLHTHGPDLVENSRFFRRLLETAHLDANQL